MRIALCNEVLRDLPIDEQARLAAALGYDGLEIAPFTLDADEPHRVSSETVKAVRRAVADSGIVVSGLHWLLVAPPGLSITSADPQVRDKTREVMRGLVRLCADLGGRYLVHGSPGQRRLDPGAEADGRARALDFLGEAARAAEAANVTYILEPLSPDQTNFVTSVAEAAEIVAEIGSPALRTMVDCSSAGSSERAPIPDLLDRYLPGGPVAHVHFNDPNRRGPGQGDLDFAPIVGALKRLSYAGWVGVEPFDYVPDGPAAAARAIGYIAGLRAALR
jgi:D-psicose/D-tagatose/L-ribulose 3-epimerase